MFILYANKNQLAVRKTEPVTSGSVNVYQVRFEFSNDWDGLERIAVFKAGAVSRSILLGQSGECTMPWEVLSSHEQRLLAGVYGTRSGEVVLPTVWAGLGVNREGVTTGEAAPPPTPDLWEQQLARKGDGLNYDGLNLSLMSGDTPLSVVQITGGEPGLPGQAGSPIGTVIAYMGTQAPEGYLVCDGAEYQISAYENLADHFKKQFGSVSFFGGDGTSTFAVPDLRNLFLRGYHGKAEEQLSGEIGKRQEATRHVTVGINSSIDPACSTFYGDPNTFLWSSNRDSQIAASTGFLFSQYSSFPTSSGEPKFYTSRPVNMAVLYCIKAA